MARKGKRGGYRAPANPAPVSLPGSGARTDTAASQPVREFNAQRYGQRTELREQQQAAPLAAAAEAPAALPVPQPDLFRPTESATAPRTKTLTPRQPAFPDDPDMLLRVLNTIAPHPDIERLLDRYR